MRTDLVTRTALLADGVGDDEIRRALAGGRLARVRPGTYLPAAHSSWQDRAERHRLLVRATLDRLSPDAVVADVSAVALHGLPLWGLALDRVHVVRPRDEGGRRGRRVHVHPRVLTRDEVTVVDGLAVTTVARTVVDLACRVPFEQGVVVADAALRADLVTSDELTRTAAGVSPRRGCGRARRVAAFADGRSESMGESRSRVAIQAACLPAPVPQWVVRDGSGVLVARADFGWPERRVVGEFDGLGKYRQDRPDDRSAAEVVVAEKLREDRVRDLGLRVVRWTWSELADFLPAHGRLARALGAR